MKRHLSLVKANTPVVGEGGYVRGKITHVSAEQEEIKRAGEDAVDVEYTVFHIETMGGAGRPIKIRHKCSTKLNGEKYVTKENGKSGKKDYNKLTRTCLQLGLLSEEELLDLTDDVLHRVLEGLESIKDLNVRFKLSLDKKSKFFGVNIKSLMREENIQ